MSMSTASLGRRFDPRRNSLSVLRLSLAGSVAVVHAQAIGWGDQPLLGQSQLGDLAVDGFFVISGFLVTRSAVRLPTIRRFAWHRALRILPGFWVCLLVTAFVVAPLIAWQQGRPPGGVFTGPGSAFSYLSRNATLLIRQWDIAGLLSNSLEPAIDGSLWTLFFEALCYAAMGGLVAVGVIRRRSATPARPPRHGRRVAATASLLQTCQSIPDVVLRHLILGVTAVVWAAYTAHTTGLTQAGPELLFRFLLLFLFGALGQVYAHRLHFGPAPVTVAIVTLGTSLVVFFDYRPLGAPAFAYLFLWAIVALPLRWEPPADLSYGTYIYHWPVVQLLTQAGLTTVGRAVFTVTALAITAIVAFASWRLIEAPCLAHKNAAWIDQIPNRLRLGKPR